MKPIKLVMSAFGPYKSKVEIDFKKLGNNGVFLITGDTGSGKTTIFDAISFALFGETSGSRRESSSLRSDFADSSIKTFVELEFLHKGIVYKIERVPKYVREKVRGSGTTSVSGDATLTCLNEVITGEKNVTEKCINILGINANQFKQIVMIAQGEFMELLHSKPRDRAIIFRKIFGTDIYKNISEKLKEKYLDKKREYEDVLVTLNSYKNNIIWEEDVSDDLSINSLLELLEEYNNNLKIKEINLKLEKSNLDKEYEKILKNINEGNLINDSIVSLDSFNKELSRLLEKKDSYDEKVIIVKRNKDIIEKINPKKELLNTIQVNLDLKEKEKDKNILIKKDIDNKYNELEVLYNNIPELEKKLEELNIKKNVLENKLVLLKEINNLEESLNEKNKIFKLINLNDKKILLDKFNNNNQLENILALKNNEYKELSLRYKESNKIYVDSYEEFLNAQVGIIASNLKDNCPCPVCGSLEHPNVALISTSILTKEAVDKLKREVDDLGKNLENLVLSINSLKKDIEIGKKELFDYNYNDLVIEVKKIEEEVRGFNINISKYDRNDLENEIIKIDGLIRDKVKSIDSSDDVYSISSNINNLNEEIDILSNRKKEIIFDYQRLSLEKERYSTIVISLENEISGLKEKLNSSLEEYISSYKELGYDSEDDYLIVVLECDKILEIENEISLYNTKLIEVKSNIKSLELFLKDKSKIDVEVFETDKRNLEDDINKLNVSLEELNNRLFNNLGIYKKIKNVYDDLGNIEQDVMVYKDLSDTANGTIAGKNKLEFEQYVQANYFDMVVMSANKRFSYMTDDRYLLARKEESTKISDKLGLELEVIDNYTGKRRDIKTLSGGESFKAALSLALGMSDVIQEYAGGVVVDAMFIDEGFGSLDDTSLEQAMNAIMMLSQGNKIIGIISHVNELKSRIDKKIIVKKSNYGSSVELCI